MKELLTVFIFDTFILGPLDDIVYCRTQLGAHEWFKIAVNGNTPTATQFIKESVIPKLFPRNIRKIFKMKPLSTGETSALVIDDTIISSLEAFGSKLFDIP